MASVCQAVGKQPPVKDRWDSQVGMETTGESLGQTPAEVLTPTGVLGFNTKRNMRSKIR